MRPVPGIALPWGIYLVAGVAWAFAPNALDYSGYALLLVELSLAALIFPAARLDLRTPMTPLNWALFLWQVHAVLLPLLGVWNGFDPGLLPRLPGAASINNAMVLSAVAHLAFSAGAQLASKVRSPFSRTPQFSADFNGTLAVLFIILGLLGLMLTFGGVGGWLRYVSSPQDQMFKDDGPASVSGAAGTFIRHFLPLGLILAWSNGIAARRGGRYVLPTLLLLVALIPATSNYNRASMVGPVLAVLAAYSAKVKKLSARSVMAVGAALLLAALAVGAYRAIRPAGAPEAREQRMSTLERVSAFLQVYAAGPQFTGFILERTGGSDLHLGSTMLSSALYPVPVLGKDYRQTSGFIFYNRLIYGRDGIVDQVIPAVAELWLNFHLGGVALFFAAVGFAVGWLNERFHRAKSAFSAAACFLLSAWTAFPIVGAVSVVSQIFIYSFWPLYVYFGLRLLLGLARTPQLSVRAAA